MQRNICEQECVFSGCAFGFKLGGPGFKFQLCKATRSFNFWEEISPRIWAIAGANISLIFRSDFEGFSCRFR